MDLSRYGHTGWVIAGILAFFALRVAVCEGQIALKRDSAYFLVFCRFGVKFHPDLLGAETAVYPALT